MKLDVRQRYLQRLGRVSVLIVVTTGAAFITDLPVASCGRRSAPARRRSSPGGHL